MGSAHKHFPSLTLAAKRRKRDLNPRAGCPTYTLSRGASSASWVFLQIRIASVKFRYTSNIYGAKVIIHTKLIFVNAFSSKLIISDYKTFRSNSLFGMTYIKRNIAVRFIWLLQAVWQFLLRSAALLLPQFHAFSFLYTLHNTSAAGKWAWRSLFW